MRYYDGAGDAKVLVQHLRSEHMCVTHRIYLLRRVVVSEQIRKIAYAQLNDLTHNMGQAACRSFILSRSLAQLASLYAHAKRIHVKRRSLKRSIRLGALTRLCRRHRGISPNPSITVHTALHDGMTNASVRATIRHVLTELEMFPAGDVSFILNRVRVVRHTGPTALSILQNIKKVCSGYVKGVVRP